jgi:hypothetical protein
MTARTIRIGAGSGWAGDRIGPAAELVERGDLDYLIYETMAETTVSRAREQMLVDPSYEGYDFLLEQRMLASLAPCRERGVKIISNQGWANPEAAQRKTVEIARDLGLRGLKVAAVGVNDITDRVRELGDREFETGAPLSGLPDTIFAAEPYMGADGIVEALGLGADVVLTSRISDNSLCIGPIVHEFGWQDTHGLAVAGMVGHLLECSHLGMSGGFMADPPRIEVPGLRDGLGLPIAEVREDHDVVFTKLQGTGGFVSRLGVRKKLLHEIGDPANYVDPNVILDLGAVEFEEVGVDRVRMTNVVGRSRPQKLKVNIACREGYFTQDQAYYAGPRSLARARLLEEILRHRIDVLGLELTDLTFNHLGRNSVYRSATPSPDEDPWEVVVRFAARSNRREHLAMLLTEFDATGPNGPFGTGKGTPPPDRIRHVVSVHSTLVPREIFHHTVSVEEV